MSNPDRAARKPITNEFKKKILSDLLLEKSLKFADSIQDEDQAKALELYQDPFAEERRNDEEYAQAHPGKALDLQNGGMADVNLIKTLRAEPIFRRTDWNKAVDKVIYDKCKDSDDLRILVVKFQIYMLLSVDDELRNVLHIACRAGSPLLENIVEQAYQMQILHFMINAQDELGQTPLYLLCLKGHGKKAVDGSYPQHAERHRYIKLLVMGTFDPPKPNVHIAGNAKNLADWLLQVSQVKYSPLHWLAYWNDYPSIEFLLSQVDTINSFNVMLIMHST